MYILYHMGGKTTILKLTRSWTENASLLWNNNLIDGKLAVLCQILLFVDVLCLMYMCVLLIARTRLWSHFLHPMYWVNEKWQVHWSTHCAWPDQCLSGVGVTLCCWQLKVSLYFKNSVSMSNSILYCVVQGDEQN